jgi:hypothetical protein
VGLDRYQFDWLDFWFFVAYGLVAATIGFIVGFFVT